MKKLLGILQDRPFLVSAIAFGVTVLHALLTFFGVMPDIWAALSGDPRSDALALYLGVAGAASLVAGFSGVVIIFGLSSNSARFQQFRAKGSAPLRANWMSTLASAFSAAGLALLAAVFRFGSATPLAPWLMEFALLMLLHSACRLLWLMHRLAVLVKVDDAEAIDKGNVRPIPPMRRKRTS